MLKPEKINYRGRAGTNKVIIHLQIYSPYHFILWLLGLNITCADSRQDLE